MAELKPCPFCGEPVNITPQGIDRGWGGYEKGVCIRCDCGAEMGPVLEELKGRLVSAWNRRSNNG